MSSTHCLVPGHSSTFIIAKTSGINVLSGEFLFRAGGEEYNLLTGGSIWLPRGIPHVWANTATIDGKLILMCQPGGFEKFFEEIGRVPVDKKSSDTMRDLMAKYGVEMLGPPIFASSWMQQHS